MKISPRVQAHFDRSPEEVFDVAADYRALPRFLNAFSVIPGVVGVEMLGGAQPSAGAGRRVSMSDGTTIDEEVLAFDRGKEHRYRWLNPPAPPFSVLVRGAEGRWLFERSGAGTKLVWI